MPHPYMLTQYKERATLTQTFIVIEQLNKGLYIEEVGGYHL